MAAASNFATSRICIPVQESDEKVVIFADELPLDPSDYNDLIDVLRAEFAPLNVWRECAIEYHRQGFRNEFTSVLNEIVESLQDPDIDMIYRERAEYVDGITEIFAALAADALQNLAHSKHNVNEASKEENARKVVEYLKLAEEKKRYHPWAGIIKGFYEILQGDAAHAEGHFRFLHERAKANPEVRRYRFGALLGLGLVAYSKGDFKTALSRFIEAITINPACAGSVRLALACCCFKLEEYDRTKAALDKAFEIDPTNANVLVMLALLEQINAKRDRTKRIECRNSAFEYCTIASVLEPKNSLTLNLLANHYFFSWKVLVGSKQPTDAAVKGKQHLCGAYLLDSSHVLLLDVTDAAMDSLHDDDQLMLQSGSADGQKLVSIAKVLSPGASDYHSIAQSVDTFLTRLVVGNGASSTIDALRQRIIVLRLCEALSAKVSRVGQALWDVQVKELDRVEKLAQQALRCTTQPSICSESFFILGKVSHSRRNINKAFDYYTLALKNAPDMTLAAFGAAQIMFSRKELAVSLELFEKVLTRHPEDKDTQAYVYLLKALHKREDTPFDKLREVAPGFQFETELWLVQGELRQKRPSEHLVALKCYTNGKECILQKGGQIPPDVLSNIAVLSHSLGRFESALEYCKSALRTCSKLSRRRSTDVTDSGWPVSAIYSNSELEGLFYGWKQEPSFEVQLAAVEKNLSRLTIDKSNLGSSSTDQPSFHTASLRAGEEIIVADVKHTVVEIESEDALLCSSPFRLAPSRAGDASSSYSVFTKECYRSFNERTTSYCFNLARAFEEVGSSKSASEIYIELLKSHPSFIECYLRLSIIYCDMGKFDDASIWLSRALRVKEGEPDATVGLGDLYARSGHWDEAKRCYEKIVNQNKRDARSMLSLGNFYFSNSSKKATENGGRSQAQQLKDSYKFYFHVLNDDRANVYAANGLGTVCAAKKEFDSAREIFSRAREANMTLSEDISTNLGHVHSLNGRCVDAEHLYQSAIKSLSRRSKSVADKVLYLLECIAFAQCKSGRDDEAVRSLLRALHLSPDSLRNWFNLACVMEHAAYVQINKPQKIVMDLADAATDAELSHKVFHILSRQSNSRQLQYDRKLSASHSSTSKSYIVAVRNQLEAAEQIDIQKQQDRQKQESEHQDRLNKRREQQAVFERAQEDERRQKQAIAQAKSKRLEELQERWVQTQGPEPQDEGGANELTRKKRPKKLTSVVDKSRPESDQHRSDDDDLSVLRDDAEPNSLTTGNTDEQKESSRYDADLFGEDDDDEEQVAGKKRSATIETEPLSTGKLVKKPRRVDNDEEDEGILEL